MYLAVLLLLVNWYLLQSIIVSFAYFITFLGDMEFCNDDKTWLALVFLIPSGLSIQVTRELVGSVSKPSDSFSTRAICRNSICKLSLTVGTAMSPYCSPYWYYRWHVGRLIPKWCHYHRKVEKRKLSVTFFNNYSVCLSPNDTLEE